MFHPDHPALSQCPTRIPSLIPTPLTGSPVLQGPPTPVPSPPTHPHQALYPEETPQPALAPTFPQVTCPAGIPSLTPQPFSTFSPAETPDLEFLITPSPLSASIPEEHAAVVPAPSPTTPSLLPRLSLGPNGLQGFQPNVHPQLPVVLQHRQQHHPALLPRLLQVRPSPAQAPFALCPQNRRPGLSSLVLWVGEG